jgi:toxin ParE1/3/4
MDNIETVEAFPNLGRIVPEFNKKMIREILVLNYRVIYRIQEKNIEIVRIIHHARDFNQLKK